MHIGNIDLDKTVLVIAEIGLNHEGDFALAESMLKAAARAGAHAVKFQTIVPDKLVSTLQKAAIDLFARFQFSRDQFRRLKELADREGVIFLSTPFDIESAEFLDPLVPAFKIASGDNNHWPLIEAVAKTGKPLLISTGLADLAAVGRTKDFVHGVWAREKKCPGALVFLHCVSLYPTPPDQANLFSISFLKEALGTTVGYSDHTLGIDAAVLAVALGARVIEKHFTLDKNHSDFPDHAISMDPADLALLCRKITETETLLGVRGVTVDADQLQMAKVARRSIVAKTPLAAGRLVALADLDWVRPGGGLPPGEEHRLTGKSLKRAVQKGEQILPEDVA